MREVLWVAHPIETHSRHYTTMKIDIELNEADLKQLVVCFLSKQLGVANLDANDIDIQVKSKQNYKSEWERADIRLKIQVVK